MRSTIQGNTNVVKGIAILVLAILISLFTVFLATGLSDRTSATGRSAAGINGDQVSLSNYFGSPIVLNFWASWCPPCREETPHFEKIWRLHPQKDVVVLGINVQDTLADADKYLTEFDVTFTNGRDRDGKIMVDYGVTGLPVTFFIDREGIIIGRWVGSIGESSLKSRVESLENDSFQNIYGSDKNQDGFRRFN